jgi:hypothetical protein
MAAVLMCLFISSCATPTSGTHWLQCSLITTTDAAGMTHHIETYVVDFTSQRLYSYVHDAGEIINLKNVLIFPEMINQNVESSGAIMSGP